MLAVLLCFGLATTPASAQAPLTDIAQVSAGGAHTCALTTSGGVKCWGSNSSGQLGDGTTTERTTPVDVSGLTSGVSAIAAGENHTCAVTTGGGVKCWGANNFGQLGDGTTTQRLTPVDVSGLTSGVSAIASGALHTCALTTSGGVKCWGRNSNGQLGDSTTTQRLTPVDVSGLGSGVSAIAAGGSHTCVLTTGGAVKCWGSNFNGQLGDGTTTQRLTAVDVSGLTSGVSAISAGQSHTCARTTSGGVKCWGRNFLGQLGDGTTTQRLTPVDVSGLTSGVSAISTGSSHTCAVTTAGGAKCWGSNGSGLLGDGTFISQLTPIDVSGLSSGVSVIAAGNRHTCAVTTAGGVKCWGDNGHGQLGDGTTSIRLTAVDVFGLSSGVSAIAAGGFHTCALTTSGGVKCWGSNLFGTLGDGTTTQRLTPVDVSGLGSGVSAIAPSNTHTCAVTTGGGAKCWGSNSFGHLGDGTQTNRLTPVDVTGLTSGVSAIAAGGSHTCALTTSGGVKCWGFNGSGQLGDGTTTTRLTAVDVSGLTSGVSAIAAGGSHTCALTTSGGVKCWGSNLFGTLGDGTTTQRLTPVDASGLGSGVSAIAPGPNHTCALTAAGGVKCWGNNFEGQLGDGTTTQRLLPVDVSGLTGGVSAIALGFNHTCALTAAGGVKCWGSHLNGQLGIGGRNYGLPGDVVTSNFLVGGLISGLGAGVSVVLRNATTGENLTRSVNGAYTFATAQATGATYNVTIQTQPIGQACTVANGSGTIGTANVTNINVSCTSTESRLASAQFSQGSVVPAFDPNVFNYDVIVSNSVESVAITASPVDPAASLRLNGQPLAAGAPSPPIALAVGVTPLVVSVTAADGISTRDYRFNVVRLSNLPAALSITILRVDSPPGIEGLNGTLREYQLRVTNLGSQTVTAVQLSVPQPAGLSNVLWTCAAPGPCTPAQGSGGVSTVFDLGAGRSALVALSGEVAPGVAFVELTASASTASGGSASATGRVSDPANGIGLFKDGFD